MSVENPWQRRGSKIVYTNPWITVREDDVVSPGGVPGIYGVVETRVATGVVALTETDEIYLVGQYRYPVEEYSWEIPEGGSNPDEDPMVTAQRELKEETGLTATEWTQLGGEIHLSNCFSSERGFLYVARGLLQGESEPDHTEQLVVKKVPIVECLAMVDRGEIKDSLSIIAILRVTRVLEGRRS
jgi:8-oxo-dGTP pyrophosphatase MutT (NUDIX family)